MLNQLFLVGAGGFVGAIGRYSAGQFIYFWFTRPWIPYATMFVNIAGCLLIGILAGWAEARPQASVAWRLFLMVGLLGGFTTFSSFGLEAFELLRLNQAGAALAYAGIQLGLGLAMVAAGFYAGQWAGAPSS